jgi:hypothetical protein
MHRDFREVVSEAADACTGQHRAEERPDLLAPKRAVPRDQAVHRSREVHADERLAE